MPLEPFGDSYNDELKPCSSKRKRNINNWVGLITFLFMVVLPLVLFALNLFGIVNLNNFFPTGKHISTQERYYD